MAGCGPHPATRGICGAGGRKRKEGRKPRRPQGARQGPNGQGMAFGFPLPHDRAATRCAPDHAARVCFASPCRSGLARGGFAGPRLRPSSSPDRPRRKSHARPGVARPRSLRTCSGGAVRLSPCWRKTKARRFPARCRGRLRGGVRRTPPRAGFAARAVGTARRAASRVARRARGKARTGKEWPSDSPCRMIEPQRAARLIMRQGSASRPLAGRALRGAASPARACGPPQVPTARAANHAASRASARSARRTGQRTYSGGTVRLSPRWRKTKARRGSRRASCWLWSWLRLSLAALQEQREAREGQRGG